MYYKNNLFVMVVVCVLMIFALSAIARDRSVQTSNLTSDLKDLYQILGMREDANDKEIIDLLQDPNKRIIAITLIKHKHISSAVPQLLNIVNDSNMLLPSRLTAAGALCLFGNREWVPVVKNMMGDVNGMIPFTSEKYNAAGLLARAGDFSQFDVVVKGLSDEKDFIQSEAIYQLGNFASPTDPVTDSAATLLSNIAKSDKTPRFRDAAIGSLEKLAKEKSVLRGKVIEALEANIDSTDKDFQVICKAKLREYNKISEPNSPPK
jgi:hypothetical protein